MVDLNRANPIKHLIQLIVFEYGSDFLVETRVLIEYRPHAYSCM